MKRFISYGLLALVGVIGLATVTNTVIEVSPALADAKSAIRGGAGATGVNANQDYNISVTQIVNAMLYVLGAIAVVIIVIGGIMYTVSTGDSAKTKRAKDTILYAVVGLIVALLAFAIVNFVIGTFIRIP